MNARCRHRFDDGVTIKPSDGRSVFLPDRPLSFPARNRSDTKILQTDAVKGVADWPVQTTVDISDRLQRPFHRLGAACEASPWRGGVRTAVMIFDSVHDCRCLLPSVLTLLSMPLNCGPWLHQCPVLARGGGRGSKLAFDQSFSRLTRSISKPMATCRSASVSCRLWVWISSSILLIAAIKTPASVFRSSDAMTLGSVGVIFGTTVSCMNSSS